ncbi:hypothetical protein SHAL103562_20325 [Shewanella algae]
MADIMAMYKTVLTYARPPCDISPEISTKLLTRLNIPHENWLKLTTEFGRLFRGSVGTLQELSCYCEHLEKRRRHFATSCQYLQTA